MPPGNTNGGRICMARHIWPAALVAAIAASAYLKGAGIASGVSVWLACFALVPLFAAIKFCRPHRSMLCGVLWGAILYSCSVANDSSAWASVGLLAAAVGVPALYAYAGARLTGRIGFSPTVLGLGWVGVELALEPLGLCDNALLGMYAEGTLVHWIAGVFGYVVVAFLVAYISALCLSVVTDLCVAVSRVRPVRSVDHVVRLITQTFECFPLFVIRPCEPRAPPVSLLSFEANMTALRRAQAIGAGT